MGQLTHTSGKPSSIQTQTTFNSRVKDIVLTFKYAHGSRGLEQLINQYTNIQNTIDEVGAITKQVSVSFAVSFLDGRLMLFNIHSNKSHILIGDKHEIKNFIKSY